MAVSRSHADAAIDLSSTYRVSGARLLCLVLRVRLSSGSPPIVMLEPCLIASASGAVKYATSIGNVQEPCGTPVFMSFRSSHLPSRQIAAFQPCTKEKTPFYYGEWDMEFL